MIPLNESSSVTDLLPDLIIDRYHASRVKGEGKGVGERGGKENRRRFGLLSDDAMARSNERYF